MRIRLIISLALALLAASCGDDGVFSTAPTAPASTSDGSASTTTGSATSTTGTAETTSTTVGVVEWAWSRVAADGSFFGGPEDQDLASVVVGGPGLVAVGSDFTGGDFDAAVWTSADGSTWNRVPHDEALFGGPDYQRMRGVALGGPGLVAVGFDGSGGDWDAAVWTSADGITWNRVPHDEAVFGGPERQTMQEVVAGGPGLVAFGRDTQGGDFDVAVWTSADGITWSRVPHDEALFGGPDDQDAWAMAAGGPALVMVGEDYSGGDFDVAVWGSADGITWSRVPHDEAVLGGPDSQVATGLAVTATGLVLVGTDYAGGDSDAAVWTSSDGSSWSRVPHDEAVFGGSDDQGMRAVVAAGGRLVAIGGDYTGGDRDVAVWISADGITWSRVPHDEAVFGGPGDQWIWQVVAGGPGLVAIGQNDTGADRDGAMWVATPSG